MEKVNIIVYGREQICPSCIGAPGSKDTYEWLQAAIGRKYNSKQFTYEYVDMDEKQDSDKHQKMIDHMIEDDLLYPLVVMNDKIIAEGIPHIKSIFNAIDQVII